MCFPRPFSVVLYVTIVWLSCASAIPLHDSKDHSQSPEEFITAHSNHRLSRDFILSLYNNLTQGVSLNQAIGRPKHWQEVNFANTVRSFPAIASHELRQQIVYRFNVSQINSSERLRVAELRVKFPPSWSARQHLSVVAVASEGNAHIYASSIPIVTSHSGANEYRIIDITSAVRDWLEFAVFRQLTGEITLDLAFSVLNRHKAMTRSKLLRQLDHFYENQMPDSAEPPLDVILVTYTESGGFLGRSSEVSSTHHRSARSASDHAEEMSSEATLAPGSVDLVTTAHPTLSDILAGKERPLRSTNSNGNAKRGNNANSQNNSPICRRKDMEIDFPALGWGEWVVYPTQFNAFQCTGSCGGFADSQNNPTNHAIVQSLVKLVSKSDIPASCCTPTKLLPLSILYLEKGSVVIKHHEEMIVDECGCM